MAERQGHEYGRVLDLAATVLADMSSGDPYAAIAGQVNDCFRGTLTVYQHFGIDRGIIHDLAWEPKSVCRIGRAEWTSRTAQIGDTHPLAPVYGRQETLAPLRISDVASDREWRRTPCYDYVRRDLDDSTRHLGVPLPAPSGVARAFLVCRSGRDYDDRDVDLARRLQPLLLTVDRHLIELRRLRDLIAAADVSRGTLERNAKDLRLTPRELTVLGLLAEGLTSATIGRRLAVTTHTVNKHLENIYRKLEVKDRLTAVLLARDLSLVPLPGNSV